MIERISIDNEICHGKPCIAGTRIPIYVILEALASGMNEEEIISEYPPITKEDIKACIFYASLLAQTHFVIPAKARIQCQI